MNNPLLRLFFALPCPTLTTDAVVRWRDALELPGKPVSPGNLHLTLAFLGTQPAARLPQLKLLAGELQTQAFDLCLDQLGQWPDGLLHLAPSQPPAALLALAGALRERLLDAGFAVEKRSFKPHLTLIRQCPVSASASVPGFAWAAREFALYQSENRPRGVHYRRLASWSLAQTH